VGKFGIAAIVSKEIIINQQLHAFLPNGRLLPKYIAYCIKYQKAYCEKLATATTIAYLNKENCNSIPIPLVSFEEQHEIVQGIESRLSVCDKLEETITESLLQAEALRQSILKKAFEGKLVPQDPKDELANVLLERIREESCKHLGEGKSKSRTKSVVQCEKL